MDKVLPKLPALVQGKQQQIVLTKIQVASFLAGVFFGLHPPQNRPQDVQTFNPPNYCQLDGRKWPFLQSYFGTLMNREDLGKNITIRRQVLQPKSWSNISETFCEVEFRKEGGIGDDINTLDADFANEYLGGGVLESGCL